MQNPFSRHGKAAAGQTPRFSTPTDPGSAPTATFTHLVRTTRCYFTSQRVTFDWVKNRIQMECVHSWFQYNHISGCSCKSKRVL
jgi:hypothetical protein